MRKIVQVSFSGSSAGADLFALCDDGTLWKSGEYCLDHTYWRRMPDIPQDVEGGEAVTLEGNLDTDPALEPPVEFQEPPAPDHAAAIERALEQMDAEGLLPTYPIEVQEEMPKYRAILRDLVAEVSGRDFINHIADVESAATRDADRLARIVEKVEKARRGRLLTAVELGILTIAREGGSDDKD